MMIDTHRSKRNEHAQSTRRANHPRVGTGVLRSKVEGSSKILFVTVGSRPPAKVGQAPQRLAVELFQYVGFEWQMDNYGTGSITIQLLSQPQLQPSLRARGAKNPQKILRVFYSPNPQRHTRAAYCRAIEQFLAWCERHS
jgi:hypothetical protein